MNDIDKIYSNIKRTKCEKDGRIKRFVKLLEKEGFVVQEGSLRYRYAKAIKRRKPAQLCFSSLTLSGICNPLQK